MRSALKLLLPLCLAAEPAFALSCLRPNIAVGFNWAADQSAPFAVAFGTLTQTETYDPPSNAKALKANNLPVPLAHGAEFKGQFLSAEGLDAEVVLDVTVQEVCTAAWCGIFPEERREMAMIFAMTDQGLTLEADPCQVSFIYDPTPEVVPVLQSCLAKGFCSDAQVMAIAK